MQVVDNRADRSRDHRISNSDCIVDRSVDMSRVMVDRTDYLTANRQY